MSKKEETKLKPHEKKPALRKGGSAGTDEGGEGGTAGNWGGGATVGSAKSGPSK